MHKAAYHSDSNLVVFIGKLFKLDFGVFLAISPMKFDTNYSPPSIGDDASTMLACLKRVPC